MTKIWDSVINKGNPIFIVRDLNIEQLETNDSERGPDLEALIPILQNVQKENNLVLETNSIRPSNDEKT